MRRHHEHLNPSVEEPDEEYELDLTDLTGGAGSSALPVTVVPQYARVISGPLFECQKMAISEYLRLQSVKTRKRVIYRTLISYIRTQNKCMGHDFGINQEQVYALQVVKACLHSSSGTKRGNWPLNNQQWFEMMGNGACLFSGLHDSAKIREDQRTRADKNVHIMMLEGRNVLRTMDGHGRFIYSFFQALVKRGLSPNDYSVELYDTDPIVNEWHRHFMPSGVTVVEDSILCPCPETTQLYLNFCGLGSYATEVLDFLKRRRCDTFISFSLERYSQNDGSPRDKVVKWILDLSCTVLISRRSNFITWWISPPKPESLVC